MEPNDTNPFDLIRAAEYSDSQIHNFWVDFSGGEGGLLSLLEPTSKTSKLILGGKGSGKTHLMRHCSYPVQKLRHPNALIEGISREGYLGIFLRANILDTGRFNGKGQPQEKWGPIFNYYFEIRLVEQLLSTMKDMSLNDKTIENEFTTVAKSVNSLFDVSTFEDINSLDQLHDAFVKLRKEIDYKVNNCVFTRDLSIDIKSTHGNLLFGIPKLIITTIPSLRNLQFLYLIDEVENLSEEQQKFINTLIRHREDPCSFRLGARLYGIKTHQTYGAEEENKEGSEFNKTYLDQSLRSESAASEYEKFARKLCLLRLIDAGLIPSDAEAANKLPKLDDFFETPSKDNHYQKISMEVVKGHCSADRKHFLNLESQLVKGAKITPDEARSITEKLYVEEYPLLEKINIFMFYQEWYRKNNLATSATKIADECKNFISKTGEYSRYKQAYDHFSLDMLAQLHRDYKQPMKATYAGLSAFIQMSAGVPRNYLVILKSVYKWASFNGERPFKDKPISMATQREAVLESSTFFFEEDARPGMNVPIIRGAIGRLAEFLREVRFSSKPVECSPLAFSLNEDTLTDDARECLRLSENWSFIFCISRGRPNKNSMRIDEKYQLNPMLSPRWDLPIGRRGDVPLSSDLANSIFDNNASDRFPEQRDVSATSLKAPYFGQTRKAALQEQKNTTPSLFDFDNE